MSSLEERYPKLWAAADRVSIVVLGSLMFWLFSGLVVTMPAALVALFVVVAPLFRGESGETFSRFWRSFRRSFGTALLLGLIDLVIGLVLYYDIQVLWHAGSTFGRIAAYFFGSLGAVALMANLYAWPLLAWYPQSLKGVLKRSLLMAAAHPFWALLGVIGSVLAVLALTMLPGPWVGLFFLFGPGLVAAIMGVAAWQPMKRYAPPEDEEDGL
ncbi:MAG: YesL family protein [Mycobacterium leprae]